MMDHDIAALLSVRPWFKAVMQERAEERRAPKCEDCGKPRRPTEGGMYGGKMLCSLCWAQQLKKTPFILSRVEGFG